MNVLNSWPARIAGVAVLALLVGVAVWWFFIRSDAELADAPLGFNESEDEANGDEAGVDPADESDADDAGDGQDDGAGDGARAGLQPSEGYTAYAIVEDHPSVDGVTQASYFADETLASVGVPSTAQGITRDVSGQFFLGPEGLDPETPSTIVVGLQSLQSDESRRDQRVREALQVGQFPDATFTATSVEDWPGEIPDGGEIEARLTGMLDLSGEEREVTWDVEARRQGDVISALATTNFLYEDFGIPVLNVGGFVSVEEDVTLQIQLIAEAGG